MTIKERLQAMYDMEKANKERDKAFAEAEVAVKNWRVDYAYIEKAGKLEEDERIWVKGATIGEALNTTNRLLEAASKDFGWSKWMIYNIGLSMSDELF